MKNACILIACALFLLNITSCNNNQRPEYIAHAGGCIDGHQYTNCLEAVNHSLSHGFHIIELDLQLTTDSFIVAAHDWAHFHEITGYTGDTASIPLAEFCSRKIYGKYTPITYNMIDSIMAANTNLYLMTDKISDPTILTKFNYRDRIMVEAFGINDYYQLDTMGFYKIFYSDSPKSKRKAFNKWVKRLLHMPSSPVPTRYTFWFLGEEHGGNTSDYHSAYGKEFAVFTAKNMHEADSIAALDKRIRYVYVDKVE